MRGSFFALVSTLLILTWSLRASAREGSSDSDLARLAAKSSLVKRLRGADKKQRLAGLNGAFSSHETPAERLPPRSIGSPTEGRLQGAIELAGADGLVLRKPSDARWGLPELVELLDRAARRVRARYPDSILLVGDLSRKSGGRIDGHRSHESGRDADVGFYFVNSRGSSVQKERFLRVRWNGRAERAEDLRFDDARNWLLVQAWLTDPKAYVQHIFVAEPLRERLLKYARKQGVYLPVLQRAAIAMKQPSHGLAHDDHFHVRIGCPRKQKTVCVPEPELERKRRGQRERQAEHAQQAERRKGTARRDRDARYQL